MPYGRRIRLRHIERADLPRFVEFFADPEVRANLDLVVGLGSAQEAQWLESTLALPLLEQPFAIDFREKEGEDWRLIGSTGFTHIDWRVRSAELGISIGDRSMWGRGLGTEATEVLVGHGFETLNLHRIWLRVYVDNLRAIRVYEKVGFVPEGRQRDGDFRRGRYRDVLLYSLLQHDWLARTGLGEGIKV
jgi:RimJ/RimL family protein N-acetyltransferase